MGLAEYDDLDGLAMAALVRSGDVTPAELAEEAIRRIEARNPALNAVVLKMYDYARDLARNGPPDGPFHGVPFLLKDMTSHIQGFPTTHGTRYFADAGASDHDSEIVARFKRAGLVTLGKTNTPELALSATTEPGFRGPSRNPWRTDLTPGGSSGGAAAAVAARMVPLAHGGDGGGSIRIPAACCGLVGLKPSRMRTPHGPGCAEIWEACCGEFALTLLGGFAASETGTY